MYASDCLCDQKITSKETLFQQQHPLPLSLFNEHALWSRPAESRLQAINKTRDMEEAKTFAVKKPLLKKIKKTTKKRGIIPVRPMREIPKAIVTYATALKTELHHPRQYRSIHPPSFFVLYFPAFDSTNPCLPAVSLQLAKRQGSR